MEFALIFPLLLLLVAGASDLTRAFFVGIEISDGARQAALYAASNPDTYTQSQLNTIAHTNAGSGPLVCPGGQLFLTLGSAIATAPSPPYSQQVVVICHLPLLTPFMPSPITIRTTATALIVP